MVTPQRLQRTAARIGLGQPTLKKAGMGRFSLEFQLPDRPPRTLARPIDSAIILEPPSKGREADPRGDYSVGETTIRYPQAPKAYFEQSTALEAGEVAWTEAGLDGVGRHRLNLVVENEHAVHVDIDRNESVGMAMDEFLKRVEDAAQRFNRRLDDAF